MAMGILAGITILAAGAAAMAGPETGQVPQPPVWVITDADSTIYMLGTVHMMREGVDWQGSVVGELLAEAEMLWLELDDLSPPEGVDAMIEAMGFSPERPLSAVLPPEDIAALGEILAGEGLPEDAFETMRPWFAYLQLSSLALMAAGLEPEAGMDIQLEAQAHEMGLPISGFETFEAQFEMLAGMAEDVQIDVLRQTIAEYDLAMEDLAAQLESWIGGDLTGIAAATRQIAEDTPEFYAVLFAERNEMFVTGIEAILAGEGTALVAVGLGHFVGPDSIPDLLAARGHRVERR